MPITLNNPKVIQIAPPTTITITTIASITTTDDGSSVTARLYYGTEQGVNQSYYDLLLWDSTTIPSYNDAGQWTDDDVQKRIQQLLT